MKSKSAEKIKLTSYDDLFGSSEVTAEEKIVSVPIRLFHTFKDHPFRVLDDEKMQETVESVKRYGILMPGIVRPYGDGEYEMVAGHRRWRACELAGMEEMPVIIREMDDDTATVIMVDTNIQILILTILILVKMSITILRVVKLILTRQIISYQILLIYQ